MKVYLIRHAQTFSNVNGMHFNSRVNDGLTRIGIEQAKFLAQRLNKENFEIIFTSPSRRTKQTASIINNYHLVPIIEDQNLNEVNFGLFEGYTKSEANKKFPGIFYAREKDKYYFRLPGGESYEDTEKRIKKFFSKLAKGNFKSLVIVTHATIIKLILKHVFNFSLKRAESYYYQNSSLTIFQMAKPPCKSKILVFNSIAHLPNDESSKNPLNFFDLSQKIANKNYTEYLKRQIYVKSLPQILNIEATNFCNLSCPMCVAKNTRPQGYLKVSLLKTIIKENKDCFRHRFVWLHFNGEPLLHPKLKEIISFLVKHKINPCLSTNAVLLTKTKAKELIKSGLSYIVFSFDGVNKDIYEKLRRGANFKKVKNNILNFLKLKRGLNRTKPITQIQIIRMKQTKTGIERFQKGWQKTPVNIISIKTFSTRAGLVNKKAFINDKELLHPHDRQKRKPCFWFWKGLIVLWDGRVVPCCQDLTGKIILGDLKKQTVKQIWNSKFLQNLRKKQIEREFRNGLCEKCLEWDEGPNFVDKIHKFLKN